MAGFARDIRNLTLASPAVNRHQKSGKDAAEWVPARNRCWFAARVVDARPADGLTVDRREAAALERIVPGFGTVDQRSDEGVDPFRGVLADVALGGAEAEIAYGAAGFAFGSRLAKSRPSQFGDAAAEFRSIPGLEWNSFTTAPGWYHTAPALRRGPRRQGEHDGSCGSPFQTPESHRRV